MRERGVRERLTEIMREREIMREATLTGPHVPVLENT